MPGIIDDLCPECDGGVIVQCDPGYEGAAGCVSCDRSCGYHDTEADIPFEGPVLPPGTDPSGWNWQELALPEGVLWYRYPETSGRTGQFCGQLYIERTQRDDYIAKLQELREWAANSGLHLEITGAVPTNIGGGYQTRPNTFWIAQEPLVEGTFPVLPWAEAFECVMCGASHPPYTTICPETGSRLRCSTCLFHSDVREINGAYFCSNCYRECEHDGCAEVVSESVWCDEHSNRAVCDRCDVYIERHIEDEFFRDGEGHVMCDDCHSRCCPECGMYQRRQLHYSEAHGMYVCRRCMIGGDDEEAFDEDAMRELHIPAIPGRENIRLCGVEIEGGDGTGNGNDLALAFSNAGLSDWEGMGGYHSGSEGGFAHVERDSSVDWEAVIGPVNLADEDDTEALNECVRSIRQLVRDGVLTLDLRAGCHIHVEAARTSLDGAYNLNVLFAYLEDVIFRLAAARWPVHRAVQDTHYTQPIPKELRKVQFAREHAEGDNSRYYALSFNNYFQQMLGRCRCGATRYDSWEDCTCSLGKCTFEFRVFNTTANPRKLHAYLALCQALVAKAMDMTRAEDNNPFPALSFVARRFKDMDGPAQEELVESWKSRLAWMFTALPLTDDEKESLAYCIRHSELDAVGEEFIGTLLPEQQVITEVTA